MHIKNLHIVTEKVTDKTTGLPYWIARGQGEIKPVVAYGPTRSEAFQYACTAIKEQGIKPKLEVVK